MSEIREECGVFGIYSPKKKIYLKSYISDYFLYNIEDKNLAE